MIVGGQHVSYCTNIHAGETWSEVRKNLETYVLAVRARVAENRRFGLGLRLSAIAAEELENPRVFQEFREFLEKNQLYVFTINGFPYGPFHGTRVKEEVYLPDWFEEERVVYSNRLARLLAALLPADVAEGTVSTVPGAFKARIAGNEDRLAHNIRRHAEYLWKLRDATGKHISLALEPEPACCFETVAETVNFFEAHLPDQLIREHVGVCFDACHMAVEWEDPRLALRAFAASGIRVPKAQISAGLAVAIGERDEETLRALEPFAEGVYLHQVVEHARGEVRRFVDLPDAIRAARAEPDHRRDWRIHFHVPIFRETLGPFANTQPELAIVLDELRNTKTTTHLEVETYCWDVLPAEHKRQGIVTAVARELEWTLERLEP